MKTPLLILGSIFTIFVVLEQKSLITNISLIIANSTQDMAHYMGGPTWVTSYNQAIWLSENQKYTEAKKLLLPLINDPAIPQKSDIAELYGDLIYYSSGSIEDTLKMYEYSLSFAPSPRVSTKIEYLKQTKEIKTASGNTTKPPTNPQKSNSGSEEREAKKQELQKISTERAQYLGNTTSSQGSVRSELQRLMDSAESGSITVEQDW